MRVQIIDPPAYSLPYDHALAAALAQQGAGVELVTSRAVHGAAPPAEGFEVRTPFYRRATAPGRSDRSRRAARIAEHVPGMLRARREARSADVAHYQWLTLEPLDSLLLARGAARVFTSHNVVRRGQGALRRRAVRLALDRMDALIAHTEAGSAALVERYGADPARVHTIPHGAFSGFTELESAPLPEELAVIDGPVVLCFGLMRPYKGIDVLIEAFRDIHGAELWVVGGARMDTAPLREAAARTGSRIRFLEQFVPDALMAALFRRAQLVVLPYRRIDQSGVLYTALAFGKAMILSDVGGFSEVGRVDGAARLVPPGDTAALHDAILELLGDPAARAALERAASEAAAGRYSWDMIARQTLALYEELT